MAKITKLTAEQKARFPEFVDKWIAIGLCTEPADRERAERAISGMYGLAKLREPRFVWLPCPLSAAMAAFSYAALTQHRRVGTAVRTAVGTAVRTAVGTAVDTAVGTAVDTAVGTAVDTAVAWEPFDETDLLDEGERYSSFREPCNNCAFRPGSSEQSNSAKWKELIEQLSFDASQGLFQSHRFYCHKGVPLDLEHKTASDSGFEYPYTADGQPILKKLRPCRGTCGCSERR